MTRWTHERRRRASAVHHLRAAGNLRQRSVVLQALWMMKVVVTGPESSGTSLVSRIFRAAGAEVFHRSATYGNDYPNLVALADSCDAMIVVYRNPISTMKSQEADGLTSNKARIKLYDGYYQIARAITLVSVPVWCITYEQLILDPNSIRSLLALLGLNADVDIEDVRNENAKYTNEHQ